MCQRGRTCSGGEGRTCTFGVRLALPKRDPISDLRENGVREHQYNTGLFAIGSVPGTAPFVERPRLTPGPLSICAPSSLDCPGPIRQAPPCFRTMSWLYSWI